MVNGSILSCFLSINLSDLRISAYALLSLVILQPYIFILFFFALNNSDPFKLCNNILNIIEIYWFMTNANTYHISKSRQMITLYL